VTSRADETLRRAALAAFDRLPAERRRAGERLLPRVDAGAWTVNVQDAGRSVTVACQHDGEGLRTACTCGERDCPHVAAVLATIGGVEAPVADVPAPTEDPAAEESTSEARGTPEIRPPNPAELAAKVDALVRQVCAHGLEGDSVERDEALDKILPLLRDRDLPDLRRSVAALRRQLTAAVPDPATASTALMRLARVAEALRRPGSRGGLRARRGLPEGAERREDLRLLEVARDTQRTPYGDRRDVTYFVEPHGGELFREIAASKPGQPPRMSEGPFPKLLVGNLVAIEPGFPPRRIRMLQYISNGLATSANLERIRENAEASVPALYSTYRDALESHDATLDPVVLFAPKEAVPSPRGVVLSDDGGRLLPLARSVAPALCEAVDDLSLTGRIVTVTGPLILGPSFLCILPLSILLESNGELSLRQLC